MEELVKWLKDNIGDEVRILTPQFERTAPLEFEWKPETTEQFYVEMDDADLKASMNECANYDHYYGGCLFRDECLVQQGERCEYFERVVLQAMAVA